MITKKLVVEISVAILAAGLMAGCSSQPSQPAPARSPSRNRRSRSPAAARSTSAISPPADGRRMRSPIASSPNQPTIPRAAMARRESGVLHSLPVAARDPALHLGVRLRFAQRRGQLQSDEFQHPDFQRARPVNWPGAFFFSAVAFLAPSPGQPAPARPRYQIALGNAPIFEASLRRLRLAKGSE